ncbi:MAG: cytochrome d ubiquinol oxidase subunit II [Bacteroidetes bacterium]|nr:cytochrome d ubiquinol oxidase subunit II [Bacteroidota bacterium]
MQTLWYALLSAMLIVYVVLDGFDFGAGIVYRFVARTDAERRQLLSAIGPVWDGNEVWLLAAGGTLFFAFPKAYAAGFSGLYMPLVILLWLLILRGLAIELRSHEPYKLWHDFWDGTLQFSSVLIAVILGAGFGNLVRGVPLNDAGYFSIPLFTDLLPKPWIGVLDYYTISAGIFCLAILGLHGALFLVWKTDGSLRARSILVARRLWWAVLVMALITIVLTMFVQPGFFSPLVDRVWPIVLVIVSLAGFFYVPTALKGTADLRPFLGSVTFIVGSLAAMAGTLFPNLIVSTLDPSYTLTAYSASTGPYGLQVGLVWWIIGMILVVFYFVFVYRNLSGKVSEEAPRQ